MHAQDDKENCLDFYKSVFPIPVHLMGTPSGKALRTRLSAGMAASNVCVNLDQQELLLAKDFAFRSNLNS